MGERKVLNKYYPPDFDGAKLPRNKRPRDQLELVRFMLPVTVRCNTCGEYMYAGKKFNVKKETVQNEDYLGLKIFRFYVKCVTCSSQFTIKTDPKNADYICETGASRNYEPWRQQEMAENDAKAALDEEEMDAMRALENRTLDAKEEMDIQDALDEMKRLRARQGAISFDMVLALQQKRFMNVDRAKHEELAQADEEDRQMAREVFERKGKIVKRLADNPDDDAPPWSPGNGTDEVTKSDHIESTEPTRKGLPLKVGLAVRIKPAAPRPAPRRLPSALSALSGYGDDDDEGDEDSE